MVSSPHNVAAKGWYIALVATTVETQNPEEELKAGLDLLGPIKKKFVAVVDQKVPADSGETSKVNKSLLTFGGIYYLLRTRRVLNHIILHKVHALLFI